MLEKFRNTGIALVTPFKNNGDIDFAGLEKLINHCINGGVEYLVSLGTTGESVNLSKEEKLDVLNFTIEKAAGRVPIVAGFGGNSTWQVVQEIEKFHFKGVDAVLSVSPYYNKPSQQGIFEHYQAIAKASPKPVIIYNVPGRTSSNIKAETSIRILREIESVIGIKEASGDIVQCMTILEEKRKEDNFLVLSGDDNLTLPLMAAGMDGVISVSGQAFPKQFSEMVRALSKKELAKATELHYRLFKVTNMLFEEGNPPGIKCALELLGICESHLRLPMVQVSEGLRKRMETEIKTLQTSVAGNR